MSERTSSGIRTEAYKKIRPREIIIYSLYHCTLEEKLVKGEIEELKAIGKRIEAATDIPVQVNYPG